MACKPKALILGHSFVRRFQLFLDQGVELFQGWIYLQ